MSNLTSRFVRSFVVAVAFVIACNAACSPVPVVSPDSARASTATPVSWAILVDVSASVADGDVPRWREMLDRRLEEFTAGHRLLMLRLGMRSKEADALVDARTAPVQQDLGRSAFVASRRKLNRVREEARQRFQEALVTRSSLGTDVLGGLERIPAGSHVLIFSDMLHSERGFDMERKRLRREDLPKLVEQLVAEGRIKPGSLRGARVWCYLTAASIHESHRPVNDRATLREFWALVFEKAGATLEHFDNLRELG
jgi:alkylhydroperoxidase family enzyme